MTSRAYQEALERSQQKRGAKHHPKKKDKTPKYSKNKAAFDSVMASYRQSLHSSDLQATDYAHSGSGSGFRAARPTQSDYRVDVERAIKKCVKSLKKFFLAYVVFDSDDPIELERHADRVMGDGRHNFEQGLGALFIAWKIYPATGRGGYFTSIRHATTKNIAPSQFMSAIQPITLKPKDAIKQFFAEPEPPTEEQQQEADRIEKEDDERAALAEEQDNQRLMDEQQDIVFEGFVPKSFERILEVDDEPQELNFHDDNFSRQEMDMDFEFAD